MFGLLLFSSCNENESESFITKEMKNYISNNVDGSYGFFERNMVKEHIDSFSWKSDIYRIQRQLYMYASQRRTIFTITMFLLLKLQDGYFQTSLNRILKSLKDMLKKLKSHILQKKNAKSVIIYIIVNQFLKFEK